MPVPASGVEWPCRLLPVVAFLVALLATSAAAQCIVDNPGGSKANINRPAEADVPAARFSPLSRLNHEMPSWLCFTLGYRTSSRATPPGTFKPAIPTPTC